MNYIYEEKLNIKRKKKDINTWMGVYLIFLSNTKRGDSIKLIEIDDGPWTMLGVKGEKFLIPPA